MTPKGKQALQKVRAVRGYTLPLHEMLAELNPELPKRYDALASNALFGGRTGRALDLKTRFLVLVGITTVVKADREGIEWASARAVKHAASWNEVYEAAFLAALPPGIPTFEHACRVYRDSDGELMVSDGVTRATRVAKLSPGATLRVEVIGDLPTACGHLPTVGDRLS